MKKQLSLSIILSILIVIIQSKLFSYPSGISGYTLKNGTVGCGGCHSASANTSLTVSITGPTILQPNQAGNYTLTMSGGSGTACGVDIASSNGTLSNADNNLKLLNGELTHTSAKNLLTYSFTYTAPSIAGQYTIYGTGCRKKSTWNHGTNFIINVQLPVELISFSAFDIKNSIILNWKTATEMNNKGFEILRNEEKIAFINGKGTSNEIQNYFYEDKNLINGFYNYKLAQMDYDETKKIIGEVNSTVNFIVDFSLSQNYPNPFNPKTNIKYQIPEMGFVTLKVFDILGSEVAIKQLPDNEQKEPGYYEIEIDATKLASGTYFYQLKFRQAESSRSDFIYTKKMLVIK